MTLSNMFEYIYCKTEKYTDVHAVAGRMIIHVRRGSGILKVAKDCIDVCDMRSGEFTSASLAAAAGGDIIYQGLLKVAGSKKLQICTHDADSHFNTDFTNTLISYIANYDRCYAFVQRKVGMSAGTLPGLSEVWMLS